VITGVILRITMAVVADSERADAFPLTAPAWRKQQSAKHRRLFHAMREPESPDCQEYRPIPSGLALPALLVEISVR